MGLIKAFTGALGGTFADQWKDFVTVPNEITEHTVLAIGIPQSQNNGRGSNTKASAGIITNGSKILVPQGFGAIFTQEGKVTNYTDEPGGYVFDAGNDPNAQSVFSGGGFVNSLFKQSWERFKFGGQPGTQQIVIYVNLKELAGFKYGTQNPIRYKDANYNNIMLGVTSFGTYSLKIVDPAALFTNFAPPAIVSGKQMLWDLDEDSGVTEQLFSELVGSMATALSAFTKGGKSIDDIQGGTTEFAQELNTAVEDTYHWESRNGLKIVTVAPAGLDWTPEASELVDKFNLGNVMQGGVGNAYAQATVAEGIKAAGENPNGGGASMMGVGMGAMGGFGVVGNLQQPVAPTPTTGANTTPEAGSAPVDPVAKIKELKDLFDSGALTEEEFQAAKAKYL
jgi:membrane protease subunit (stomatin/prohibitin family)